jgi:hypothetical protein
MDGLREPSRTAKCEYDAWKQAKIKRGLAQAIDRSAMIPAEQVLRQLKL